MIDLPDTSTRITARTPRNDAPSKGGPANLGALHEITDFGSNPGELRMLLRVPEKLPPSPALLVGLHGCTQSSESYDAGAGWSILAERCGLLTLFPEQQASNNLNLCFNWYAADDTGRDSGEAHSVRQMIDHAIAVYGIDRSRIFVTGLSAGGAMTSSLLAAYPELFAAGAIVAGLPHGSSNNLFEAIATMSKGRERTAQQWGNLVRDASSHRGSWPRLSIWHGSLDAIVCPVNAESSVLQWTNVHGVLEAPNCDETTGNHRIRNWRDGSGQDVIEAHTIVGMGHGVPLAPMGKHQCGLAGPMHFDVGVSSSARILSFFGISEAAIGSQQATPESA
jgi:poly(hydroxyalkanoate) depolymerase family esterase